MLIIKSMIFSDKFIDEFSFFYCGATRQSTSAQDYFILQSYKLNNIMTSFAYKSTNIYNFNSNSDKIASLRSKLVQSAQLVQQLDSIVNTYNASIEAHTKAEANLLSSIKNIFTNMKQAHNNPNEWLTQFEDGKVKQKQTAVLFQTKMFQFNQIFHSIATNTILIDALHIIKSNKHSQIDLNEVYLPNSKRQLLTFYRQICQYYMQRQKFLRNKSKNIEQRQDILKTYPQLGSCQLFKEQIEKKTKEEEEAIKHINLKFREIQEKLLGFACEDSKISNYSQISSKLEKLLVYIIQSYNHKDNQKITSTNVKQHNQIIKILTVLCSCNVGILQETIQQHSNQQIKSICNKLIQIIVKNSKNSDMIYEFLVQKINKKDSYKYAKSVKQLPLERKLIQCQKLIKQLRKGLAHKTNNQIQSKFIHKYESIMQQLNNQVFDKDNKLLSAEEQIYSLQTKVKCLQSQKFELINEKLKFYNKILQLQSQKHQSFDQLSNNEDKYRKMTLKQQQLLSFLQEKNLNNNLMQRLQHAKQYQIGKNIQTIFDLQKKKNSITLQKQQIISKTKEKEPYCGINSKVFYMIIQPTIQAKSLQQVINFIEDAPLNINNRSFTKLSSTPSPPKRQKFTIKHSRSLSTVDFLSQMQPQIIQKDAQTGDISTLDSEQLKKGILIRQKTIKKYEIYIQKQRKQAKKHRSQILQLQAKIRSLQLERIRSKQLIDDRDSLKILQQDLQSCRSIINMEEIPQKSQQMKSIQNLAEKELQLQLKVKQDQINFKIQEIIKHVLKLNTLKVNSHIFNQSLSDPIAGQLLPDANISNQIKNIQQTQ